MSRGSGRRRGALPAVVARVAAVTSLVFVCVGVPIWLVALGGLPFAHVDPMAPIRAAVGGGGDVRTMASWLGQVALVVAWVAWSWTATCIVLETRYWLSGRSPAHLPGSRTVQWVVAGLVGTAFALGGMARSSHDLHPVGSRAAGGHVAVSAGPGSIERPSRPVVSGSPGERPWMGASPAPADPEAIAAGGAPQIPDTHVADCADPGSSVTPGASGAALAPGAVIADVHVVSGRETLWSVADSRLGSARRWREIAELNYDRLQSDGERLTGDHWIRPGWELLLPPDVHDAPMANPRGGTAAAHDDAVSVVPPPVSPGPPGPPVPPGAPGAPDAGRRVRSIAAEPPVPTGATGVVGPHPAAGPGVQEFPTGPRSPGVPVIPVGAGIVGVGVSELVDRLRRVQQRHRGPGMRIRLPDPVLRQFEQRLRVGDGAEVLDSVEDAVLRYVGNGGGPVPTGVVLGVKVSASDVELVIDGGDTTTELPPGFRRVPGTSSVVIGRSSLGPPGSHGTRSGRARPFPLPTLVTIGRSEDRVVLVNLEGLGSLVVDGDPRDAEGIVRALALELATSRWSSRFDLVLVGFGVDLERLARVAVTSATGPLVADLSWRRLREAVQLEDLGFASVADARCRDRGAPWDPVVVICGPGVASADVEALLAVSGESVGGIAVLAVSDGAVGIGSTRRINARSGGAATVLEVLDELLEPQRVSTEEVGGVVRLLEVAGRAGTGDADADDDADADAFGRPAGAGKGRDDVPAPAPAAATIHAEPSGPLHAVVPYVDRGIGASAAIGVTTDRGTRPPASVRKGEHAPRPQGHDGEAPASGPVLPEVEVEIAVLGPVEIRGAAREFTRAWARELVVYLALHPDGASNDVWATALWPERVMAPSSLHSTASVARRSLGKAQDGSDHLPRSHGRLALGPSVGTDWDRFVALAGQDDPRAWGEALGLVRGRPFDGLRSTDWSVLDGTAPAIESAVVDLSGRLAGACLRSGDPRGAEWAARRGLVVSPYDERLYRMLLRSADAAGNPGGVESVMAELVRVVADEIEPLESVHPSTLELYRSLSRRRVTAI